MIYMESCLPMEAFKLFRGSANPITRCAKCLDPPAQTCVPLSPLTTPVILI